MRLVLFLVSVSSRHPFRMKQGGGRLVVLSRRARAGEWLSRRPVSSVVSGSRVVVRLVSPRVVGSSHQMRGGESKQEGRACYHPRPRLIRLGPVIRAAGRVVPGSSCRHRLIPSSPGKQAGRRGERRRSRGVGVGLVLLFRRGGDNTRGGRHALVITTAVPRPVLNPTPYRKENPASKQASMSMAASAIVSRRA